LDFPTVPAFAKRNQQRFHLVKEFGLLHSYASFLCCDFSADRQSTESPPTTSFWSTGGHEIQLYLGWYLVGCRNHFRLPFQPSTTALINMGNENVGVFLSLAMRLDQCCCIWIPFRTNMAQCAGAD
jgi:hypothetical protein